jgi:hypothetical protein
MKEKTKYIIITIVFTILIIANAMLAIPPTSYIVAFIIGGCLGTLLGDYLANIKLKPHE